MPSSHPERAGQAARLQTTAGAGEAAFELPAIVVSADMVHNRPGERLVVVPIGSTSCGLRSHVELEPGESGLSGTPYARCDQARSTSTRRLVRRRGRVDPAAMHEVEQALRFILVL